MLSWACHRASLGLRSNDLDAANQFVLRFSDHRVRAVLLGAALAAYAVIL